MSENEAFFLAHNAGFEQALPEDDLLHPEVNREVKGDSVTETQYFGFNVPEAGVHGLAYCWHHPNLKVLTGGIMAWKGVKPIPLACELFDMRAYMSDAAIANDLHDYRMDNGYGVRIVEPNKKFHMTYSDEARQNSVDLHYEGVTPVVMFGDRKHFEQGMRVRGKLVLRGESYDVDCFNIRDRSWGRQRQEDPMPMPPLSWMTGVFGDDLMFNCTMIDHVGSNPQCTGRFALPVEKALSGGWIWRNGELLRVKAGHKTVRREGPTFRPVEVTLHLTTEDDVEFEVTGRPIAACPWGVWPNMLSNISLMRWEAEGRVGHGDCQDVVWTDFVNEWGTANNG